ncbi:hypothetical protein BC831DRAFT_481834 [Entophlyctis helioformis]|nr:hypothetical protein BC831DRAFT_481834 [Entophlyctis helioformis]
MSDQKPDPSGPTPFSPKLLRKAASQHGSVRFLQHNIVASSPALDLESDMAGQPSKLPQDPEPAAPRGVADRPRHQLYNNPNLSHVTGGYSGVGGYSRSGDSGESSADESGDGSIDSASALDNHRMPPMSFMNARLASNQGYGSHSGGNKGGDSGAGTGGHHDQFHSGQGKSAMFSGISDERKQEESGKGDLADIASIMRGSMSTTGSMSARYPHARELSETLTSKLFEMRWCICAVLVNIILIFVILSVGSGITVPVTLNISSSIGCVVLELLLLMSNIVTLAAVDDGAAAYFGHKLASRRGFSLAVCGFVQASVLQKSTFASQLSLNSTCRKILARASGLWVLLHVILWLTPISATALHSYPVRRDHGVVGCLAYGQEGIPVDRQWPIAVVETGLAEALFGTALGDLRTEQNDQNTTVALIGPQHLGVVEDGDTLVGPGFALDISSTCVCATSADVTGLTDVGVPANLAQPLADAFNPLNNAVGMANAIVNDTDNLHAITLLSGTLVCGGKNQTRPFVPVCTTTFKNHTRATVLVSYMTDGTPASITPRSIHLRSLGAAVNLGTWAATALKNILDGEVSMLKLPNPNPGIINPLLWWMSPNMMAVDPSMIEAGLEAAFALLFRAGVQRTYSAKGMNCVRNIEVDSTSLLQLQTYGQNVAEFILGLQLCASIIGVLGFIPWFLEKNPIGPAVRLTKDAVYFTNMVHSSSVCQGSDQLCNAPGYALWDNLDTVVRVGEAVSTREDPLIGHVTMDRPKLVTAFTNGKRYF